MPHKALKTCLNRRCRHFGRTLGVICSLNVCNFDVFCFRVIGFDLFLQQANLSVFCEIFTDMSARGQRTLRAAS